MPAELKGTDAARFGEHLERLIASADLTVPEFADRVDTSKTTVYQWIQGVRIPPFAKWRTLAKALGLPTVNGLLPKLPVTESR